MGQRFIFIIHKTNRKMYLFSAASIEFFREIHNLADVPKRFLSTIMHHSAKVLHGDEQKTIFLQRLVAGPFEVFEHRVICDAPEKEILPTPLNPSLHLHISLDDNEVDAYVNGRDSVELKPGEVNLFYLEEINIAILPKGKHCFFHIGFKNETLFRLLNTEAFSSLYNDVPLKVKQVEESMGGMINAPGQVALDAYFMMLVQQIRDARYTQAATEYYREKKCMLMLEHFMRQMLPAKEPCITLTTAQVLTLDYIKAYIKWHLHHALTVQQLARQFNVSSNFLEKGFFQLNGISIRDFMHLYRMEYATQLLAIVDMPLSTIPLLTGYNNYASFAAAFKKYFNCEPEIFRHQ
jgi:AraC-like DNA-binding protein